MIKAFLVLVGILVFSFAAAAQNKTVAEDFSGTALNGQNIQLSELKGKIVVITFWSTRCQICHSEIPKLNNLAAKYQGQEVVFLGVTSDNQRNVENYLKFQNFNFTIVPDSFGAMLKYAEKTGDGAIRIVYPASFLINQNGEIEYKGEGWDKTGKLDSGIIRLLKQKTVKAD